MQLFTHGAWASLYQFSASIWGTFKHRPLYGARVPQRTDLCMLIRTIFIWAPLALAINAAALAAATFSIGFFVLTLFYNLTTVGVFLLIIAGSVIAIAVVLGLIFGAERLADTETVRIIGSYISDKHSKICTPISFGDA